MQGGEEIMNKKRRWKGRQQEQREGEERGKGKRR